MKARASKLDQFAAQIADLDAEKKTLGEICEWLASEGCRVAPSSVSVYLERLRSQRREAAILAQISNGARQSAEVEKQFAQNPAPQLETIIKLHRVMIMQLATQSVDNPELVKITDQLTRTVMEFVSGQAKADLEKQKINLADRRVRLLEAKAEAFDKAKGVMGDQALTEEQRAARMRELFGM